MADGLTVLRTFAFATDAPYALQTSPGFPNSFGLCLTDFMFKYTVQQLFSQVLL